MKNKFLKYHLKYHQNQKYLEINLTKSMQNFFTENYKTMQRENIGDLDKCRYMFIDQRTQYC